MRVPLGASRKSLNGFNGKFHVDGQKWRSAKMGSIRLERTLQDLYGQSCLKSHRQKRRLSQETTQVPFSKQKLNRSKKNIIPIQLLIVTEKLGSTGLNEPVDLETGRHVKDHFRSKSVGTIQLNCS